MGGLSLVICLISISDASGLVRPQVLPFAMNVAIDYADEPHYRDFAPSSFHQIRFLQLVSTDVLEVKAVAKGTAGEPVFLVDLSRYATAASQEKFSVVLTDLEGEDSCKQWWEEDYVQGGHFAATRIPKNGYAPERAAAYSEGKECDQFTILNDAFQEGHQREKGIFFDKNENTLFLEEGNVGKRLSVPLGADLADGAIGTFARKVDLNQTEDIFSIEVENSFWKVFSLTEGGELRLLLGPEVANPNKGFIPKSLSIAPGKKLRFAVISPRAESGLWGISVFEAEGDNSEANLIGKAGSAGIAYSEHRGFDHAVSWTSPDSLVYLDSDGLTIREAEITSTGVRETRSVSFSEGDSFSIKGQVSKYEFVQDLELFRLEAISAIALNPGEGIRIAAVGIFSFHGAASAGQIALPLLMDLAW